MRSSRFVSTLICCLAFCLGVTALAKSLQEAGDEAFEERREPKRARQALELYRQNYALHPKSSEAAWRVGMACQFIGYRLVTDDDEKAKLFAEGKAAALAAAQIDPECAACHFWAGINMALYGQTIGVFKMLFTLKSVRAELEASLQIDDTYAYGGAYRVLGLIEQKLPGILGGSNNRAREYFEKAIQAAPDDPMNYLVLDRLFKQKHGQTEKAYQVIGRGLDFPEPGPERVESRDARLELQRLAEAYKKELPEARVAASLKPQSFDSLDSSRLAGGPNPKDHASEE